MQKIITTLLNGDTEGLKNQLKAQPELANEALAQGKDSPYRVHPLHFLCDAVFEGRLTEESAFEMAEVFIDAGSDIAGKKSETTSIDTPLITATSLCCESIAVYLVDQGADPTPRGTHGGTALHWAAWTGSDRVVARLLREAVALDDQGDEFKSTPLLWAINGWLNPNQRNHRQQVKVIKLLLEAGADPNLVNGDGQRALDILIKKGRSELAALVRDYGGKTS